MSRNARKVGPVLALTLCATGCMMLAFNADAAEPQRPAVVVELFTPEGCSSCPPADLFLESLDKLSDPKSPRVVVLSEHVDYWNHIGWTDPYSSPRFSERQRAYVSRMRLESPYTPQMVIDGATEVSGNDAPAVIAAINKSAQDVKAVVRVTRTSADDGKTLLVRVEVDVLPATLQSLKTEVYLALAENGAASQVLRGENGGRNLKHVAVVRKLDSIGALKPGVPFFKEVSLSVGKQSDASKFRLVAFVQEKGQGKIIGAACDRPWNSPGTK